MQQTSLKVTMQVILTLRDVNRNSSINYQVMSFVEKNNCPQSNGLPLGLIT